MLVHGSWRSAKERERSEPRIVRDSLTNGALQGAFGAQIARSGARRSLPRVPPIVARSRASPPSSLENSARERRLASLQQSGVAVLTSSLSTKMLAACSATSSKVTLPMYKYTSALLN